MRPVNISKQIMLLLKEKLDGLTSDEIAGELLGGAKTNVRKVQRVRTAISKLKKHKWVSSTRAGGKREHIYTTNVPLINESNFPRLYARQEEDQQHVEQE